jgi:Spy/CpxP family protein refolding chaperone
MTKIKNVLWGAVGIFFLMAMPLVHAEIAGPDSAPNNMRPGQHIQEVFSLLNLTDEQKKQLEANKEQHRSKMESARQEMKTDKKALQEELMSSQLNMDRINQIHGQIKALMSQMEDERLNSILAVRQILTPDQFSRFVDLMAKHKQEHGD